MSMYVQSEAMQCIPITLGIGGGTSSPREGEIHDRIYSCKCIQRKIPYI